MKEALQEGAYGFRLADMFSEEGPHFKKDIPKQISVLPIPFWKQRKHPLLSGVPGPPATPEFPPVQSASLVVRGNGSAQPGISSLASNNLQNDGSLGLPAPDILSPDSEFDSESTDGGAT